MIAGPLVEQLSHLHDLSVPNFPFSRSFYLYLYIYIYIKVVPFLVPFWSSFGSQNGPQNGPKLIQNLSILGSIFGFLFLRFWSSLGASFFFHQFDYIFGR